MAAVQTHPAEAPPEVDAGKSDPGRLSGKVALEHVTFRYRAHGSPYPL